MQRSRSRAAVPARTARAVPPPPHALPRPRRTRRRLPARQISRGTCSQTAGLTAVRENPCAPGPPVVNASPAYQLSICYVTLGLALEPCQPLLGSVSSHSKSAFNCIGTKA